MQGVLNEVAQCIDEATKQKLDSCFSREDLVSNRLGARFGETLVISQSEANGDSVADELSAYLVRLGPLAPSDIAKLNVPSAGANVLELGGAMLQGLADILVPKAY